MKPIIIRKPKFMRSDDTMKSYIDMAATITNEARRSELRIDQQVHLLKDAGDCLKKAAKAGGFLSVGDMYEWLKLQTTT